MRPISIQRSSAIAATLKNDVPKSDVLKSDVLVEIVTQIEIAADLQIYHADYPPPDLPPQVIASYRQFPQQAQQRFLQQKLRDYLYDIYFSQELRSLDDLPELTPPLQNDLHRGLNQTFYQQLHDANQGKGYFDPDWQVIQQKSDHLLVQKQELTLKIQPSLHLQPSEQTAEVGDTVAIRLPKNRLENGFYVAVANAGLVSGEPQLEIYFNISAEAAIALMRSVTAALNDLQLPFTLKLLYEPTEYRRCDAGILQVMSCDYADVRAALKAIYQPIRSQFSPAVPLLTAPLAVGVGLAEVPDVEPYDFGLHRCQLIADGLLTAWQKGEESPEQRIFWIEQQFAQQGIDLQQPHLNTRVNAPTINASTVNAPTVNAAHVNTSTQIYPALD